MKKIIALALALAVVASIAISSTVAYFTDEESAVNVMTVGKVIIDLIEEERGNSGLQEFNQKKNLMPLVGNIEEVDALGMPKAKNFQDKIVRVKNVGESDAWVRVLYAVPQELDKTGALHIVSGEKFTDGDYTKLNAGAEPVGVITLNSPIENTKYNVYCATMKEKLAKDATTPAVMLGVYLDSQVDYDDGEQTYYMGDTKLTYDLSKNVHIPVLAQAVQYDGFESGADTAFEEAFGKIPEKLGDWFDGENADNEDDEDNAEPISNLEQLKEAFNKGGSYRLENNIEIKNGTDILAVYKDVSVTLDLNGKTITSTLSGGTPAISINSGGTLVINGNEGTMKNTDPKSWYLIASWGNLTINGGTYEAVFIPFNIVGGNLTINNATVSGDGCFSIGNNATLNIKDGTFRASGKSYCACITVQDFANVTIDGGSFAITSSTEGGPIFDLYGGKVEILNGTFTAANGKLVGSNNAVPTITGGTFNVDPSQYVPSSGYTVTESNGRWTVKKNS